MKQVWKCDYCDAVGTEHKIEVHEAKCCFKPEKKNCYSCKYMFDSGSPFFGSFDECEKGLSCFDYDGTGIECPQWEYTNENQFLK